MCIVLELTPLPLPLPGVDAPSRSLCAATVALDQQPASLRDCRQANELPASPRSPGATGARSWHTNRRLAGLRQSRSRSTRVSADRRASRPCSPGRTARSRCGGLVVDADELLKV